MKTFARILVPLVLLLIAVPSFAVCTTCDFNCGCAFAPGNGSRCKPDIDCCHDVSASCFSDGTEAPADLASQYRIASVQVLTIDVATPQVQVAQQKAQTPAPVETAALHK